MIVLQLATAAAVTLDFYHIMHTILDSKDSGVLCIEKKAGISVAKCSLVNGSNSNEFVSFALIFILRDTTDIAYS